MQLSYLSSDACRSARVRQDSKKQCSLLQDLRVCECVFQNNIRVEVQIVEQLPTLTPRQEFKPLSATSKCYEYFKHLNGSEAMFCVNPNFTPAELQLPSSRSICQSMKLAADSASMVLPALAALELVMRIESMAWDGTEARVF